MNNLLIAWDNLAVSVGLTSFQMVVVFGMLSAGMLAQWQFQHAHHHHGDHDD